jgi:hypothetical protein
MSWSATLKAVTWHESGGAELVIEYTDTESGRTVTERPLLDTPPADPQWLERRTAERIARLVALDAWMAGFAPGPIAGPTDSGERGPTGAVLSPEARQFRDDMKTYYGYVAAIRKGAPVHDAATFQALLEKLRATVTDEFVELGLL